MAIFTITRELGILTWDERGEREVEVEVECEQLAHGHVDVGRGVPIAALHVAAGRHPRQVLPTHHRSVYASRTANSQLLLLLTTIQYNTIHNL